MATKKTPPKAPMPKKAKMEAGPMPNKAFMDMKMAMMEKARAKKGK